MDSARREIVVRIASEQLGACASLLNLNVRTGPDRTGKGQVRPLRFNVQHPSLSPESHSHLQQLSDTDGGDEADCMKAVLRNVRPYIWLSLFNRDFTPH